MADNPEIGGLKITPDRLVMWAVAALLAFNTFQRETVKADSDLRLEISNISGEVMRLGKTIDRLENFTQAPRFTAAMFQAEMVPRDGSTERNAMYLERMTARLDDLEMEIDENHEDVIALKYEAKTRSEK